MDNATADTVQAAGWAITDLTIRMFLAEMNRAMTTNRLDGHTRPYWIRGSSEYIETKQNTIGGYIPASHEQCRRHGL
jgi:hypothetical protein